MSSGKSFRAEKDAEMIAYHKPLARASAEIESNNSEEKLEIMLSRGEYLGSRIATKKYFVNGVGKKMADFVGLLKASLFWPEDLDLVRDAPGVRRRYLDFVLSQVDRKYLLAQRLYEKGIRQRNKLLIYIRENEANYQELLYWDQLLITNGQYITSARQNYIDFVNQNTNLLPDQEFSLVYDKSTISRERLDQYKEEEVAAGTTLVGPHRDDFSFQIKKQTAGNGEERDLAHYGSRGEQRLGVLWLKLSELSYLKENSSGGSPIFLLDDIFSEFDHHNRQVVFGHIGKQQTIITTTDIHLIEDKYKKEAEIVQLT